MSTISLKPRWHTGGPLGVAHRPETFTETIHALRFDDKSLCGQPAKGREHFRGGVLEIIDMTNGSPVLVTCQSCLGVLEAASKRGQ